MVWGDNSNTMLISIMKYQETENIIRLNLVFTVELGFGDGVPKQ